MTVIMKVDLVGPKSRGLAVGLNEFAGYLSVGLTAFLTGYIAAALWPAAGAVLPRHRLRRSRAHAVQSCSCATRATTSDSNSPVTRSRRGAGRLLGDLSPRVVRRPQPVRSLASRARQQPQRRHELGNFPAVLFGFGLSVERIGILKAVYPGGLGRAPDRHGAAQRPMGPQGPDRGRHVDAGGRVVPDGRDAQLRLVAHSPACCSASAPRWSIRRSSPRSRTRPTPPGARVRSASIGSGATSATPSARSPPAS